MAPLDGTDAAVEPQVALGADFVGLRWRANTSPTTMT